MQTGLRATNRRGIARPARAAGPARNPAGGVPALTPRKRRTTWLARRDGRARCPALLLRPAARTKCQAPSTLH